MKSIFMVLRHLEKSKQLLSLYNECLLKRLKMLKNIFYQMQEQLRALSNQLLYHKIL
jgi:hypothetical protein